MVALRTYAQGATVLCGGAVSPRATLAECMRHEIDGRTPGFVPHLDTMDMAERQAMTLQFFRPAQVGPDGSANTSRVRAGDRLIRFPGCLALPDTPNLMPRVLLYHTAHEARNLPPAVGFRTVAGGGIERGGYRALGATMLVTDKAVIAFRPEGPRLVSFHPGETVEEVVAATGFALDVDDAIETPAPVARGAGRARRGRPRPPARHRVQEPAREHMNGPRPKGEPMPELRFDHISFMVRDLDASVEKWKKILGILDPEAVRADQLRRRHRGRRGDALGDLRQPGPHRDPAVRADVARTAT